MISTKDEPTILNEITLDDYDLEYSGDDFDEPVLKRLLLCESTRSALSINESTSAAAESSTAASRTSLVSPNPGKPTPTTFTSVANSVKYSSCPASVDKAGDTK